MFVLVAEKDIIVVVVILVVINIVEITVISVDLNEPNH